MTTLTEPKAASQLLRTLFQGRIMKGYINDLPEELRINSQKLIGYIDLLEHRILEQVDPALYPWLSKDPDVKWDIAAVSDLMQKINIEEGQDMYEEFLGLLLKSLMSILYAQGQRKKIYFQKYKAIFQLLADELKADTDGQPGFFLYAAYPGHKEKELFVRAIKSDNQTLKQ